MAAAGCSEDTDRSETEHHSHDGGQLVESDSDSGKDSDYLPSGSGSHAAGGRKLQHRGVTVRVPARLASTRALHQLVQSSAMPSLLAQPQSNPQAPAHAPPPAAERTGQFASASGPLAAAAVQGGAQPAAQPQPQQPAVRRRIPVLVDTSSVALLDNAPNSPDKLPSAGPRLSAPPVQLQQPEPQQSQPELKHAADAGNAQLEHLASLDQHLANRKADARSAAPALQHDQEQPCQSPSLAPLLQQGNLPFAWHGGVLPEFDDELPDAASPGSGDGSDIGGGLHQWAPRTSSGQCFEDAEVDAAHEAAAAFHLLDAVEPTDAAADLPVSSPVVWLTPDGCKTGLPEELPLTTTRPMLTHSALLASQAYPALQHMPAAAPMQWQSGGPFRPALAATPFVPNSSLSLDDISQPHFCARQVPYLASDRPDAIEVAQDWAAERAAKRVKHAQQAAGSLQAQPSVNGPARAGNSNSSSIHAGSGAEGMTRDPRLASSAGQANLSFGNSDANLHPPVPKKPRGRPPKPRADMTKSPVSPRQLPYLPLPPHLDAVIEAVLTRPQPPPKAMQHAEHAQQQQEERDGQRAQRGQKESSPDSTDSLFGRLGKRLKRAREARHAASLGSPGSSAALAPATLSTGSPAKPAAEQPHRAPAARPASPAARPAPEVAALPGSAAGGQPDGPQPKKRGRPKGSKNRTAAEKAAQLGKAAKVTGRRRCAAGSRDAGPSAGNTTSPSVSTLGNTAEAAQQTLQQAAFSHAVEALTAGAAAPRSGPAQADVQPAGSEGDEGDEVAFKKRRVMSGTQRATEVTAPGNRPSLASSQPSHAAAGASGVADASLAAITPASTSTPNCSLAMQAASAAAAASSPGNAQPRRSRPPTRSSSHASRSTEMAARRSGQDQAHDPGAERDDDDEHDAVFEEDALAADAAASYEEAQQAAAEAAEAAAVLDKEARKHEKRAAFGQTVLKQAEATLAAKAKEYGLPVEAPAKLPPGRPGKAQKHMKQLRTDVQQLRAAAETLTDKALASREEASVAAADAAATAEHAAALQAQLRLQRLQQRAQQAQQGQEVQPAQAALAGQAAPQQSAAQQSCHKSHSAASSAQHAWSEGRLDQQTLDHHNRRMGSLDLDTGGRDGAGGSQANPGASPENEAMEDLMLYLRKLEQAAASEDGDCASTCSQGPGGSDADTAVITENYAAQDDAAYPPTEVLDAGRAELADDTASSRPPAGASAAVLAAPGDDAAQHAPEEGHRTMSSSASGRTMDLHAASLPAAHPSSQRKACTTAAQHDGQHSGYLEVEATQPRLQQAQRAPDGNTERSPSAAQHKQPPAPASAAAQLRAGVVSSPSPHTSDLAFGANRPSAQVEVAPQQSPPCGSLPAASTSHATPPAAAAGEASTERAGAADPAAACAHASQPAASLEVATARSTPAPKPSCLAELAAATSAPARTTGLSVPSPRRPSLPASDSLSPSRTLSPLRLSRAAAVRFPIVPSRTASPGRPGSLSAGLGARPPPAVAVFPSAGHAWDWPSAAQHPHLAAKAAASLQRLDVARRSASGVPEKASPQGLLPKPHAPQLAQRAQHSWSQRQPNQPQAQAAVSGAGAAAATQSAPQAMPAAGQASRLSSRAPATTSTSQDAIRADTSTAQHVAPAPGQPPAIQQRQPVVPVVPALAQAPAAPSPLAPATVTPAQPCEGAAQAERDEASSLPDLPSPAPVEGCEADESPAAAVAAPLAEPAAAEAAVFRHPVGPVSGIGAPLAGQPTDAYLGFELVKFGNMCFGTAITAHDFASASGQTYAGQLRQVLEAVDRRLMAVGSSKRQLLKVTIMLVDRVGLNEVLHCWTEWGANQHLPAPSFSQGIPLVAGCADARVLLSVDVVAACTPGPVAEITPL